MQAALSRHQRLPCGPSLWLVPSLATDSVVRGPRDCQGRARAPRIRKTSPTPGSDSAYKIRRYLLMPGVGGKLYAVANRAEPFISLTKIVKMPAFRGPQ